MISAPRHSCRGIARRGLDGSTRPGQQHGRIRRRTRPLRRARHSAAAAARPRRARPRPVRTDLPELRGDSRSGVGSRRRASRSEKRLRRHEAPPGASLQRVRTRTLRGVGDRAAVPQRVRAANAEEHPVRRCREHLPQRARKRRDPAGLRRRRTTPRLRARERHCQGKRLGTHVRPTSVTSIQRRDRRPRERCYRWPTS